MTGFEIYKKSINFICPICKSDFSVEDNICQSCNTDLHKYYIDKFEVLDEIEQNIHNDYSWKVWEVLISLLVYYVVLISFNRHFLSYYVLEYLSAEKYLLLSYLTYFVANILFILLTLYFIKICRKLPFSIIGIKKYKFSLFDYYSVIIIVLLFAFPILIIVKYLKHNIGIVTEPFFSAFEVSDNLMFYSIIVFNMIFLQPISNEVFFRGFFYNKIKTKMSLMTAAIFVSIVYAVNLANNIFLIAIYFILSIFFCFNFQKKYSIFYNLTIKITLNLILLLFFFNNFFVLQNISFANLIIITIIVFSIAVIIDIFRYINKNKTVFNLFKM